MADIMALPLNLKTENFYSSDGIPLTVLPMRQTNHKSCGKMQYKYTGKYSSQARIRKAFPMFQISS